MVVHDLVNFIEINDAVVTFLWASRGSGYRHLCLIASSLAQAEGGISESSPRSEDRGGVEDSTLAARVMGKIALTSGEWEVLGGSLWVDMEGQLVFFLGLKEAPLEKHLCVVGLGRPERVGLLTEQGCSCSVEFDEVDSRRIWFVLWCP